MQFFLFEKNKSFTAQWQIANMKHLYNIFKWKKFLNIDTYMI